MPIDAWTDPRPTAAIRAALALLDAGATPDEDDETAAELGECSITHNQDQAFRGTLPAVRDWLRGGFPGGDFMVSVTGYEPGSYRYTILGAYDQDELDELFGEGWL